MFEWIMLGLRKIEGVELGRFKARFGADVCEVYKEAVNKLENMGWLTVDQSIYAPYGQGPRYAEQRVDGIHEIKNKFYQRDFSVLSQCKALLHLQELRSSAIILLVG